MKQGKELAHKLEYIEASAVSYFKVGHGSCKCITSLTPVAKRL